MGLAIGLLLPVLFCLVLFLVGHYLVDPISRWARLFTIQNIVLVSVFTNLAPIRIYFVNLKFDKTGRGVLLITFIMVIAFFATIRWF